MRNYQIQKVFQTYKLDIMCDKRALSPFNNRVNVYINVNFIFAFPRLLLPLTSQPASLLPPVHQHHRPDVRLNP